MIFFLSSENQKCSESVFYFPILKISTSEIIPVGIILQMIQTIWNKGFSTFSCKKLSLMYSKVQAQIQFLFLTLKRDN